METTRYCKHCSTDHPLTKEFWQRIESSPRCKFKLKNYNAKWRKENSEQHKKLVREWRLTNREKVKEHKHAFFQRHKVTLIAKHNAYCKSRRKTDIQYRLAFNLRRRLNIALRKGYKTGSAVADLGCSIPEFKSYMEAKFKPGMTWDNYGIEWHIDHIRPLANYDLVDKDTFLQLVHYTNLQPLWAADNIRKSNKE